METLHGHCHFGISPIITGVNFGYCSKWTAQPVLFIVGNYFFYDTLYIIICSPFFCGRFRIFQSYHKTMLISAERPGITCTLHHWFQIPFILLYYTRSEPTLIITSAIPPGLCACFVDSQQFDLFNACEFISTVGGKKGSISVLRARKTNF